MSDVGKIVMCTTLQGNKFITVGTAYEVEQDGAFHYTVKNDRGVSTRYSKECFEETPKKVEKQKIKVLCVKNTGLANITVDRVYDAEEWGDKNYLLVDDEYKKVIISKCCFIQHIVEITIKPPLGLKPRKIYWEELNYHRRKDIIEAMHRYMEAKMDIPVEWCKELIDLVIADNKGEIQC